MFSAGKKRNESSKLFWHYETCFLFCENHTYQPERYVPQVQGYRPESSGIPTNPVGGGGEKLLTRVLRGEPIHRS